MNLFLYLWNRSGQLRSILRIDWFIKCFDCRSLLLWPYKQPSINYISVYFNVRKSKKKRQKKIQFIALDDMCIKYKRLARWQFEWLLLCTLFWSVWYFCRLCPNANAQLILDDYLLRLCSAMLREQIVGFKA